MEEVAYISICATEKSLILMDELGRGTSSADGIAIARSVIDHFHAKGGVKMICSTHYHELIDMETRDGRIENYHADIENRDGDLVLTYRILPGGSAKSFGIEVAKKVGLPADIISRAQSYMSASVQV
jgi:DNA mismatch repair protein MutS